MNFNRSIGYCGNVYPAATVAELLASIGAHWSVVRESVFPDRDLPLGIWLSRSAVDELFVGDAVSELKETLDQHCVSAFTINGFPYGDFHQPVVKHSVYLPNWTEDSRRAYSIALADLHDQLLPQKNVSTISTLPLGWPHKNGQRLKYADRCLRLNDKADPGFLNCCAEQLRLFADTMAQRDRQTVLCLEPEPGCVLDSAQDVCDFFQGYLLKGCSVSEQQRIFDHVGVCHDVCHSAVMFEEQADAIASYRSAGLRIGKVQVSSAIEVDFDSMDDHQQKQRAWQSLGQFSEPKYLHQTSIRRGDEVEFFEDLNIARGTVETGDGSVDPQGVWRVHFHVPVFAGSIGDLGTTQASITQCMNLMLGGNEQHGNEQHRDSLPDHFEVETYAWNVLPRHLQRSSLTSSIVDELRWFQSLVNDIESGYPTATNKNV